MTIPKNVFLAAIVILIISLLGVAGFIIFKPKTDVPPIVTSEIEKVAEVTPISTPTPAIKTETVQNQIELIVLSPKDGSIVKTNKLTVKGTTVPAAEVFINDLELKADTTGSFSGILVLEQGDNPITITAVDDEGNYSEEELTVIYEL